MTRNGKSERRTKEVEISIGLDLDQCNPAKISSSNDFFDHLLESFALNSGFSIELTARSFKDEDLHHLVEDSGIVLGKAFAECLGDFRGINRYGFAIIPMDEALQAITIDLSKRPGFYVQGELVKEMIGQFSSSLAYEFFQGFSIGLGCTIHIELKSARSSHHQLEGLFKAFGRAMKMACKTNGINSIPSTKGSLG